MFWSHAEPLLGRLGVNRSTKMGLRVCGWTAGSSPATTDGRETSWSNAAARSESSGRSPHLRCGGDPRVARQVVGATELLRLGHHSHEREGGRAAPARASSSLVKVTSRRSPSMSSGHCWRPWPGWVVRTGPRPTCGCPPDRLTRHSPPCRPIRRPASAAASTSWPAPTGFRRSAPAPTFTIAAMGALLPEALAAAERLTDRARRKR